MTIQKFEITNVKNVKSGDTIYFNDDGWKTISKKFIKDCPFFGRTIYGQTFRKSNFVVKRALFPKWYKGKVINWVTQ